MGTINHFDIQSIRNRYGLEVAVETGTYLGEGTMFLTNYFPVVHTIEILESYYQRVKNFGNSRIVSYLGNSADRLMDILPAIQGKRCLFWLDAHLPSHYQQGLMSDKLELPLEDELRMLVKHRDVSLDYFVIDDLRIYEDGPFVSGNWEGRKQYSNSGGIGFIFELFRNTHTIERSYDDQGYIILKPKPLMEIIHFKGNTYPQFQSIGNAAQFCIPYAKHVCKGIGVDVGCNREEWKFPGAIPVDPVINQYDALNFPRGNLDYVFSSHCLEHIPNWVTVLDYWTSNLRPGGVLFLYLPDYSQVYWRPWHNRKHVNILTPQIISDYLNDSGYVNVFASGVDLNNAFMVMAEKA